MGGGGLTPFPGDLGIDSTVVPVTGPLGSGERDAQASGQVSDFTSLSLTFFCELVGNTQPLKCHMESCLSFVRHISNPITHLEILQGVPLLLR